MPLNSGGHIASLCWDGVGQPRPPNFPGETAHSFTVTFGGLRFHPGWNQCRVNVCILPLTIAPLPCVGPMGPMGTLSCPRPREANIFFYIILKSPANPHGSAAARIEINKLVSR